MWRDGSTVVVVGILGLLAPGCGDDEDSDDDPRAEFALTSPAFSDGERIPSEHTCDGKDFPFSGVPPVDHVSPELNWTAGPAKTRSYAVVFKDVTLTTGTPVNELGYHWAIWNIPPTVRSLPEALASGNPVAEVPGAKQFSGPLFNDGYVGPCPSWAVAPGSPLLGMTPAPTVSTDSYTFTVFALPTESIEEPNPREETEDSPPISYVKDLDDLFESQAIAKARLGGTSDAQPAAFAPPPAAN